MKIDHVNGAHFAQQIVWCYDQKRLGKEPTHGCLMKSLEVTKYQICGYELLCMNEF